MPYPCCCRQSQNGAFCYVCGSTTPTQLALTWPSWRYYYYAPFPTEKLIAQVSGGTHILSQVPGGGGCCYVGPTFAICRDAFTSQQLVDRLFVWASIKIVSGEPVAFLTAGLMRQESSTIPAWEICGRLAGANRDSPTQWSKATLAGCRSGPYTGSVSASDGTVYPYCAESSIFTRWQQTAGTVTLNAV